MGRSDGHVKGGAKRSARCAFGVFARERMDAMRMRGMKKILIVDDAAFMRRLIRNALESVQYEICAEAANGREGVELFRQHKPDLVTLDIVMPEMDGVAALRAIRSEWPSARVIMITAVDQRQYMQQVLELGVSDFVVKPFDDDRIVMAVERALSHAR